MKVNAIVLAAGIGSRLMPLTGHIPKPALPVGGEPLVNRVIRRLKEAGVERIAVNLHHLPEQIVACVDRSPYRDSVTFFPEPELLNTAGPLINAKKLLAEGEYFILHNGDAACDFDLKAMLVRHIASGASLTMALLDGPDNRVLVDREGRVLDINGMTGADPAAGRKYTYACVSVFSRDFLDCLPGEVRPCSFGEAWGNAFRLGKKIMAYFPGKECFWNDIGSFEEYFAANSRIADGQVIRGEGSRIDPGAVFSGFNIIGRNCEIGPGVRLRNCILLDGARAPEGYSADQIFGRDFSCHREEKRLQKLKIFSDKGGEYTFSSLPEQGSDRKFYRVRDASGGSRILMCSGASDRDFERFIRLGRIFSRYGMLTPEIFAWDISEYTVLMEDLGRQTLYDVVRDADEDKILLWYRRSLEALMTFQEGGREAVGGEDLEYRIFNRKILLWESEYFIANFLNALCGLSLEGPEVEALKRETAAVALAAEKMPCAPMHRDYQSQNIMICGDTVRLVDFQGSRFGPYTYDAASLIRDPYVMLSSGVRRQLRAYYHRLLSERGFRLSREIFTRDYLLGALQRNMQALGAYGFLSLRKGKPRYLRYAAPCLKLLMEGIEEMRSLPDAPELETLEQYCRRAEAVLPERVAALSGNR